MIRSYPLKAPTWSARLQFDMPRTSPTREGCHRRSQVIFVAGFGPFDKRPHPWPHLHVKMSNTVLQPSRATDVHGFDMPSAPVIVRFNYREHCQPFSSFIPALNLACS